MPTYRTVQQHQRRANLHDFVVRQINAGRGAREVLEGLETGVLGVLVTFHQVSVRNEYGGRSNRKADRVETLCREVYNKIKPEFKP